MRVRESRAELEAVAEAFLQLEGEGRRLIPAHVTVLDDVVREIGAAQNRRSAGDGVDGAVQRAAGLACGGALDTPQVDVLEVVLVDRLGVDEVHGEEEIPR